MEKISPRMLALKNYKEKREPYFKLKLVTMIGGQVPRRLVPELVLDFGKKCCTENGVIVIGLDQELCNSAHDADTPPDEILTDEAKLDAFINYIMGHECQHIISTANKPWRYGINSGVNYVINQIQSLYGYPVQNFAGDNEKKAALARMAKDGHKIPTYKAITNFVHFVCNSVEDGRIERLRALRFRPFATEVRFYRNEVWKQYIERKIEDMPKTAELLLYLNETLTLATSHVYARDMFLNYGNTEYEVFVFNELLPLIAEGVYAKSCKKCMDSCIQIVKKLTPTFLQSVDESEDGQGLEDGLDQAASRILNGHDSDNMESVSEKNEQLSDRDGNPFSDNKNDMLEAEQNGQNEKKPRPDKDKSGSEKSGEDKSDAKNPQNGSGQTKPEGDSEGGSGQKGSKQGNSGKEGSGREGSDGKGKASGSEQDETSEVLGEDSDGDGGTKKDDRNKQTRGLTGLPFDDEKIRAEIEAAAKDTNEVIEMSQGNVFDGEKIDIENVADDEYCAESIAKEDNIRFSEYKRQYELDCDMPYIIQDRATRLKAVAKVYFKPKKTGHYRNRPSGSVDGSSIYKLGINQFDCFKKPKKPEDFSGAVYLLIDNSGSMGIGRNSKRQFACEAAAEIEYAFGNFLPMKITAFDETGRVIHSCVKNWEEKSSKSFSYNFFQRGRAGGGNIDYDSIHIATKELLKRKEKEKLLIVISDGLPCGGKDSKTPEELVREEVNNARASGIRTVGVYIEETVSDTVRKKYQAMYGNDIVFTTTDEISDNLAQILTSFVHF